MFTRKIISVGVIFAGAIVLLSAVCRYGGDWSKSWVNTPLSESQLRMLGTPYWGVPKNMELLSKLGDLALFAGETIEDSSYNEYRNSDMRKSLFLRVRRLNETEKWRILLTTDSNWREYEGMSEWQSFQVQSVMSCFCVRKASFSLDGRHIWLVCESNFAVCVCLVCSYDVQANMLRVLIDGDTAKEQPDGTILVRGKLNDENGESLGARWCDVWITPEGKIVRKGKLMTIDEMIKEAE